MRILIAEDDQDISESYKDALEARNHTVTVAYNGDECLRKYAKELKRWEKHKGRRDRRGPPFERASL